MEEHVDEMSPLMPEERIRRVSRDVQDVSPIIHERDDSITIRRPVQYYSLNNKTEVSPERHGAQTQAAVNRYKYYSKLAPHRESILLMPNHVVPPEFFTVIPIKLDDGKQSSIVTIFSIWNTMMGTSLLSMPWAVEKAGFTCGICTILIMSGLTLYTAYLVLQSVNKFEAEGMEFADVCRHYLGRWGMYISTVFSLIALLGAAIVYWVLMSNFLFNSVAFIFEEVNHEFNKSEAIVIGNVSYTDAICPHPPKYVPDVVPTYDPLFTSTHDPLVTTPLALLTQADWVSQLVANSSSHKDTAFHKVWDQFHTVPFFLVLVLAPLINFKSPTFFTKFNALGTVSVAYILTFVAVKAAKWGFHIDSSAGNPLHVAEFSWAFPALTGTLSLALFIHNCVISIVRNQKHPENNGRDLAIAYACVCGTYLFIGVLFYSTFPLPKDCIEDNLLNNFANSDTLAFVARIFLFFQMITVFPLLMYIFRVQIMFPLFGTIYPGLIHVIVLNACIIAVCLVFAILLPHIGAVIRFSGSLCGLAYIFTLPCVVYMLSRKEEGTLTWPVIVFHVCLIILGVLNFIAQFLSL